MRFVAVLYGEAVKLVRGDFYCRKNERRNVFVVFGCLFLIRNEVNFTIDCVVV